jgi:peptidoglycan/xylan/chitin deacetylase (PgdA/CDA1 family)
MTVASLNILLYHGVTSAKSAGIENFSGKHVSAEDFRIQMRYLSNNKNVVSLREGVWILNQEEKDEKEYVCVTFDDTYENIYTDAFPILKDCNVPATFFISTGYINTQKMFWTDKLENIFNMAEPGTYFVDSEKIKRQFILSPASLEKDKIESIKAVKKIIKAGCTPLQRDELINHLSEAFSVPEYQNSQNISNYSNLSSKQIKEISDNDLFDVGGHSVNHEILSFLSEKEVKYEVEESIRHLEGITGKNIDLYSYPEGQRHHYNDAVIKILKESGIKISPSAVHGINTEKTSPFHLKRVMVGFESVEFPYEIKR